VAEGQASRRPVSAAMFDLDHFKLINDHHGHQVGDAVIAAAAAVLRDGAPDGAIVGRMGGEEFALVLQGLSATEARWRIEHLRAKLASLPEPLPRVTASAGVAQLKPGEALSDLMRRADIAAYDAKRAGRDRLRVSAESGAGEDGGGRSSAFLG
jgi:diguanylate cyclase (GGDEF)-like protein